MALTKELQHHPVSFSLWTSCFFLIYVPYSVFVRPMDLASHRAEATADPIVNTSAAFLAVALYSHSGYDWGQ